MKILKLLTIGIAGLGAIAIATAKNSLGDEINNAAKDMEARGIQPEEFLAHLDKQRDDRVPQYAQRLDQLDAKCTQRRTEVAVMSAILTKKQNEIGVSITQLEGAEQFLGEVEFSLPKRKKSQDCLEVYLRISRLIKKEAN